MKKPTLLFLLFSAILTYVNAFAGPRVSINFDDGQRTQFDTAAPIFEHWDIPATLYFTVNRIEKGKATWQEVIHLHNIGWEIGSHSMTHRNMKLLSKKELHWEFSESKKQIESQGIPCFTFAYPECKHNWQSDVIAEKYYDIIRDTIVGRRIFVMKNTRTKQDVINFISSASDNDWLIITFHGIVDNHPKYYQVTTSFFRWFAEYVAAQWRNGNIEVTTMTEYIDGGISNFGNNIRLVFKPDGSVRWRH